MSMSNRGINKLMEECAEVIVEAAKLSAYPDGTHPDGKEGGNLLFRLENEIADARAAMEFVEEKLGLNVYRGAMRMQRKAALFRQWDMED